EKSASRGGARASHPAKPMGAAETCLRSDPPSAGVYAGRGDNNAAPLLRAERGKPPRRLAAPPRAAVRRFGRAHLFGRREGVSRRDANRRPPAVLLAGLQLAICGGCPGPAARQPPGPIALDLLETLAATPTRGDGVPPLNDARRFGRKGYGTQVPRNWVQNFAEISNHRGTETQRRQKKRVSRVGARG